MWSNVGERREPRAPRVGRVRTQYTVSVSVHADTLSHVERARVQRERRRGGREDEHTRRDQTQCSWTQPLLLARLGPALGLLLPDRARLFPRLVRGLPLADGRLRRAAVGLQGTTSDERPQCRRGAGAGAHTEACFASFFCFSKPWKPKRPILADLPLAEQRTTSQLRPAVCVHLTPRERRGTSGSWVPAPSRIGVCIYLYRETDRESESRGSADACER